MVSKILQYEFTMGYREQTWFFVHRGAQNWLVHFLGKDMGTACNLGRPSKHTRTPSIYDLSIVAFLHWERQFSGTALHSTLREQFIGRLTVVTTGRRGGRSGSGQGSLPSFLSPPKEELDVQYFLLATGQRTHGRSSMQRKFQGL